jgi:hypothetical protein
VKHDPRQAIRQFAVTLHDPKAPNAISADGLLPFIRYLLANAPWSELVDISGAVSLIFSAATRAEAVRKEEIDTSRAAPPSEWADIVTDEILRYPRTYMTLIKLPGLSIEGELNLTIGNRARIIRSDLAAPHPYLIPP